MRGVKGVGIYNNHTCAQSPKNHDRVLQYIGQLHCDPIARLQARMLL
jgi:hypothetical protein